MQYSKITSILSDFKKFMDEQGIEFSVCGSIALYAHGIPLNRDIHDIDIHAVLTDPAKEDIIKILAAANKTPNKRRYSMDDREMYIFNFSGVVVNAFLVDNLESDCMRDRYGIRYNSIESVLRNKKMMNRDKDNMDILNMVRFITANKNNDLPFNV